MFVCVYVWGGGGGRGGGAGFRVKDAGKLERKFELTAPKGDQSGRGSRFFPF